MQVTETLKEGLKRSYQITFTADEINVGVDEKLAKFQPEVAIKGFRKGKVPMTILRKQYGDRARSEAMDESLQSAVISHFMNTEDRPAAEPKLTMVNPDWKEGEDIVVEMFYEALPEIPDIDVKGIKLERLVVTPGDADVDKALDELANSVVDFEDCKKGSKAKMGDRLMIDFKGLVDGKEFKGGTATNFSLVLKPEAFIAGFVEQLVGVAAGQELDVNVTFPADYPIEYLRGKDAVFACSVNAVQIPVPSNIDDEFAKNLGAGDLDALKDRITEGMASRFAINAKEIMRRKLLDALDKLVKFDSPPSLVESEAQSIAQQLWHEDNPDVEGQDPPEVKPTKEHEKLAERRVRLGIFLKELGNKNGIKVSLADVNQALRREASQYPGREQEFMKFAEQNPQVRERTASEVFEKKLMDYIFELADITDKNASPDDLQKAMEKLDAF